MVDRNDPKAVAAWEERQRARLEQFGVSKLEDMLTGRKVGSQEVEKFVGDKLLPEMREKETAARAAEVAKDERRHEEMRAIAQTAVDHAAKANEHAAEANEIAEQARDEAVAANEIANAAAGNAATANTIATKSVKVGRRGVWVALAAVIIALIALFD